MVSTEGAGADVAVSSLGGELVAPKELPRGPAIRVLFLGNSLTASNNLPGMVQALAAAGGKRLEYAAITPGGVSLDDHWPPDQAVFRPLTERKWDYLVLQQGPSSQPESQRLLAASAARISNAARKLGVTPALYGVWPTRGQRNGFDLVCGSYRKAAQGAEALLFPAGEAWRAALTADPAMELYSPDNLHPTPLGTYLAALVLVEQLAGIKPEQLPAEATRRLKLSGGERVEFPEAQARQLQRLAAEANRRHALPPFKQEKAAEMPEP